MTKRFTDLYIEGDDGNHQFIRRFFVSEKSGRSNLLKHKVKLSSCAIKFSLVKDKEEGEA